MNKITWLLIAHAALLILMGFALYKNYVMFMCADQIAYCILYVVIALLCKDKNKYIAQGLFILSALELIDCFAGLNEYMPFSSNKKYAFDAIVIIICISVTLFRWMGLSKR